MKAAIITLAAVATAQNGWSGEDMCERGRVNQWPLNYNQCMSIGSDIPGGRCCTWDQGRCWSAVGPQPCYANRWVPTWPTMPPIQQPWPGQPQTPGPVQPIPGVPAPVPQPLPGVPAPVPQPLPGVPAPVPQPLPGVPAPVPQPLPGVPSPVPQPLPGVPAPVPQPLPGVPAPVPQPLPGVPAPVPQPLPGVPAPVPQPLPGVPTPMQPVPTITGPNGPASSLPAPPASGPSPPSSGPSPPASGPTPPASGPAPPASGPASQDPKLVPSAKTPGATASTSSAEPPAAKGVPATTASAEPAMSGMLSTKMRRTEVDYREESAAASFTTADNKPARCIYSNDKFAVKCTGIWLINRKCGFGETREGVTLEECAAECFAKSDCLVWNYKEFRSKCYLYKGERSEYSLDTSDGGQESSVSGWKTDCSEQIWGADDTQRRRGEDALRRLNVPASAEVEVEAEPLRRLFPFGKGRNTKETIYEKTLCKHEGLVDIRNMLECKRACKFNMPDLQFSWGEFDHNPYCFFSQNGCYCNTKQNVQGVRKENRQLCYEPVKCEGEKTYIMRFDGEWNRNMFPLNYPNDAHFSEFTVAAHDSGYNMFRLGAIASHGLEAKAENGTIEMLNTELEAAMGEGFVLDFATSPTETVELDLERGTEDNNLMQMRSVTITVDGDHPYISGTAMVAPSSAWFTGFDSISMCDLDTGKWMDVEKLDINVYDSGTDAGEGFTLEDIPIPEEEFRPIRMLECDGVNFCETGESLNIGDVVFHVDNSIVTTQAGNCKHFGLVDILEKEECERACKSRGLKFDVGEWIHSPHCWFHEDGESCHWNTVPYPPEIDPMSRQLCQEPVKCSGSKTYDFVFNGEWNPQNFPIGFPADAHFSQFTVAAHNDDYIMFKVGGKATPGMETKAESGMGEELKEELENAAGVSDIAVSDVATVEAEVQNGIGEMQMRKVSITVDADHPYVSGTAMIAPSSSWFTGFDTIPMCNQITGEWVEEIKLKVAPVYDAGTDSGHCFECADQDASDPISILYCDGRAFCDSGEDTLVDLGMFTFTAQKDKWSKYRNYRKDLNKSLDNTKNFFKNLWERKANNGRRRIPVVPSTTVDVLATQMRTIWSQVRTACNDNEPDACEAFALYEQGVYPALEQIQELQRECPDATSNDEPCTQYKELFGRVQEWIESYFALN